MRINPFSLYFYIFQCTEKRSVCEQKCVGLVGVEPTTSPLSGVRSNQLSYRPICNFMFAAFYDTALDWKQGISDEGNTTIGLYVFFDVAVELGVLFLPQPWLYEFLQLNHL